MQSLPPRSWLLRLLLIAATFTTAFQQASQPLPAQTPESRQAADASPPDTRLDRIKPVESHEAPETFELVDGYRLELVAAEPLVNDPVAFCFDARGRLIVVEMRGYSERPEDLAGRVRRLSDRDGDGRMDTAETLIDELSWPTAVACWGDGVLVAVAPDILYADGRNPPKRWFTGFGRGNVQGLINSFRWGLDNRIHGAPSSSGATVTGGSLDEPLQLSRRDFAISPLDRTMQAVEGGAQHGLSLDPWGDKFVCSNSDHLQQVLLPGRGMGRATRYSDTPPLRRSIATDGPQADVFRISPVEPWRILRTHLRVSGQAQGPIEGGGRAAGYFTGATGVYYYDGDQWPEAKTPIALVCDVGSNLVHRKRLLDDGLWKQGERIDSQSEFVRSRDIWFRPVQLGTGPDGALYIADMYREVIEHPKSLPPLIKSQLDLNSGNRRGRIWRVVAKDRPLRRAAPALDDMSTAELVTLIDHPNAWHRRTAARLIFERQDAAAIEALRALVRSGTHPAGRLQALASLDGLQRTAEAVDDGTLQAALRDPHARVRQHAVKIVARRATPDHDLSRFAALWTALAEDPSIFVRFQLAYESMALIPDSTRRSEVLATIAAQDPSDPWIRWAVEGSLGAAASDFVPRIHQRFAKSKNADLSPWMRSVACQLLYSDGSEGLQQLVSLLEQPTENPEDAMHFRSAVADQLEGLAINARSQPLSDWIAETLVPRVRETIEEATGAEELSAADLRLIRWAAPDQVTPLLKQMLQPTESPQVQELALKELAGRDQAASAWVVENLSRLTPTVRDVALQSLAEHRAGLNALAEAVLAGRLAGTELPDPVRRSLGNFPDQTQQEKLSEKLKTTATSIDPAQLAEYEKAIAQQGDPVDGQAIFRRDCINCHRMGTLGNAVGPDLRSLTTKSPSQILLSILDPNAEVDPKYRTVQVITNYGRVVSGVLESETEDSLRILSEKEEPIVIPREDIESLQTTNRSLMPTDVAKEISPQQMNDLITFLRSPAAAPATDTPTGDE